MLILAGAVFFLSSSPAINSVAILPFVNDSKDPNAEYLSDGLTESIINSLSQLPNLKVMSRNAAFRFKGSNKDPVEAGRNLNVGAVLTGRLVKLDDQRHYQNRTDQSRRWIAALGCGIQEQSC